MTQTPLNDLYRRAMEADDGSSVSAGARAAHVKAAAEAGRSVQVDLSEVPAELRPALLVEIRALIREHATRASRLTQVNASAAAPQ